MSNNFFTDEGVYRTRAASRRECSVSSLPMVIMRSTSGLTALALGTVVMTRSCSMTLVTRFLSSELRAPLDAEQLALVQMVTPVTEPARLRQLCAGSQGFVYAVTMTGTTGKHVAVPDEVLSYLDRVRAGCPIPVCAGFGIRSREQVKRLRGHVDGVVIGSALVEVLERGEDPAAWLRQLSLN